MPILNEGAPADAQTVDSRQLVAVASKGSHSTKDSRSSQDILLLCLTLNAVLIPRCFFMSPICLPHFLQPAHHVGEL